MNDCFETVLDEFKANESPEAVLVVGDDPNLVKVVLAWPNVPVWHVEEAPAFSENWSDIGRWNWLWRCVQYRKWDLENAVGSTHNLDKNVKMLIANRILYPDGSVHSYVTRYLRDRVVKLFETKPRARSRSTK
jgi:hypothetical protein